MSRRLDSPHRAHAHAHANALLQQDDANANANPAGLRQACDSCHFKKLRCVRANQRVRPLVAGRAANPCSRCTRLGVECIFSPPLKFGRPRKQAATAAAAALASVSAATAESGSSAPRHPPPPPALRDTTSTPYMYPQAGPGPGPRPSSSSQSQINPFPTPQTQDDFPDPAAAFAPSFPGDDHLVEEDEWDAGIETMLPNHRSPYDVEAVILAKGDRLFSLQQQLYAKRRELTPLFSFRRPAPGAALRSQGLHDLIAIAGRLVAAHIWHMNAGIHFSWRRQIMNCTSDETTLVWGVFPAFLVLDFFLEILQLVFPPPPVSSLPQQGSEGAEGNSSSAGGGGTSRGQDRGDHDMDEEDDRDHDDDERRLAMKRQDILRMTVPDHTLVVAVDSLRSEETLASEKRRASSSAAAAGRAEATPGYGGSGSVSGGGGGGGGGGRAGDEDDPAIERNPIAEFTLLSTIQGHLASLRRVRDAMAAVMPRAYAPEGAQRVIDPLLERYAIKLDDVAREVARAESYDVASGGGYGEQGNTNPTPTDSSMAGSDM